MVRVHYIERDLKETRDMISLASDAPTTKPPSDKDLWSERKDTAKEIGTGLKWLAAILLLVALIFKKIEPGQLPMLKSWFGIGG